MDKNTTHKYIEAVGRRKTSVARVRITPAARGSFTINDGKSIETYFKNEAQRIITMEALHKAELGQHFAVTAKITGGGVNSQAEALRLGIARALIQFEPASRKTLKKAGFLKRDQRAKERRKFGLKKARKAPQWSKR
jgi:small subunit ribosomal protein S9